MVSQPAYAGGGERRVELSRAAPGSSRLISILDNRASFDQGIGVGVLSGLCRGACTSLGCRMNEWNE